MQTLAVIDFETTGLSPNVGARATEIAVVLLREGAIVGQYQSLMKTGARVPAFIEQLTGISNAMLVDAPEAGQVMRELAKFTSGCPMVAHNAAFDRAFWQAELLRAECDPDPEHQFVCTLLLARRLYPEAENCKLGTLARHHRLPPTGRAHRALADAMTTAHLLLQMQGDVKQRFAKQLAGQAVDHRLLRQMQRSSKSGLSRSVQQFGNTAAARPC